MIKLNQLECKRTTTMFYIDKAIETYFDEFVNESVDEMSESIKNIDTIEGLVNYIKKDVNSIDNLIVLLGISVEKFKRAVSFVRIKKGFTFDAEWEPRRVRSEMVNNSTLMTELCELFATGYKSPNFMPYIPKFILDDFKINSEVIARLQNRDYLTKLIKTKFTTEYNNKCSNAYLACVRNTVTDIAGSFGLKFGKVGCVNNTKIKNVDAICFGDKYIIINAHFSLTTSSGQTKYYENVINPLWNDVGKNPLLMMINILDGAGWIGRPSDYSKIYYSCNYFLNLQNISKLDSIIREFFNI